MGCRISIVVPVYQVEDYIENTMESIVRQSFRDFEVVLVNDGTIDASLDIAERILKTNKINYKVINQQNKGVSVARNIGIKNSSGEWVVCIDADDVIQKDFLKLLYNGCIENSSVVAIGNFQTVSKENIWKTKNEFYTAVVLNKEDVLNRFLTRDIKIISPGVLIRKDIFINNNLWYNEKMRFSEDQHFIWRMLFTVDRVVYYKTRIYNYLKRDKSIMTSSDYYNILTGYHGFLEYACQLDYSNYRKVVKYIFPRWILAALRTSSKLLSLTDFNSLAKTMEYKTQIKALFRFPDYKTKLLSLLLLINSRWFYVFNRII
jgi:glycosyltransferase involved in cell wall biosynthesis